MSRDYAAEMRAVIDEMASGSYAAPVVAAEIVEKLRANDPELLDGWLHSQAVGFVRHAINLRDASVRTHNRIAVSRSVFRRAAENAEAGDDTELMTNFLGEVYVVEGGMKMPLREMKADDLLFAAEDFTARAQENAMRAAFLRALAKKCHRKPVGEVFDEAKLAEMWRSVSGGAE